MPMVCTNGTVELRTCGVRNI